ncbi:MAG: hypothetical protein IT235_04205 [Bacteroidia bacterium]|nr:hypothetical protein [Bacteroidia bacterium]
MIQKHIKSVIATTLLTAATLFASAQCKNIAKKQCFPQLAPYIQNGQFNSAKFAPGENAEIQMVFYAGQNYRLMVCAESILGDVSFKIIDMEKNELYSSKKSGSKMWDFNVASTQAFIVQVDVPANDTPNEIIPDGCVSIIVGFKKQ